MFIVETWLDEARLLRVLKKLKLKKKKQCVFRETHGGELVLLWKDDAKVLVLTSSTHHIDAVVN